MVVMENVVVKEDVVLLVVMEVVVVEKDVVVVVAVEEFKRRGMFGCFGKFIGLCGVNCVFKNGWLIV